MRATDAAASDSPASLTAVRRSPTRRRASMMGHGRVQGAEYGSHREEAVMCGQEVEDGARPSGDARDGGQPPAARLGEPEVAGERGDAADRRERRDLAGE